MAEAAGGNEVGGVQDRRPPQGAFVGRAAEVAHVTDVIARVATGQPWLVAIEGDPGVGLVDQLLRAAGEVSQLIMPAGAAAGRRSSLSWR